MIVESEQTNDDEGNDEKKKNGATMNVFLFPLVPPLWPLRRC